MFVDVIQLVHISALYTFFNNHPTNIEDMYLKQISKCD